MRRSEQTDRRPVRPSNLVLIQLIPSSTAPRATFIEGIDPTIECEIITPCPPHQIKGDGRIKTKFLIQEICDRNLQSSQRVVVPLWQSGSRLIEIKPDIIHE